MRTPHSRMWAAWAVAALCCTAGVAAPAGAADRVIAENVGSEVDAFLGTFAWGEPSATGDDSRLVLFSHGARRFAPVRAFGVFSGPPVPNLGPGPHGAPVAAYSRCSERFGCDLFAFGLRSGREHKVRALSTRRWWEGYGGVAVWGRRYLFTRNCAPGQPSRCQAGEGLFVAPPLRRISRALGTEVDMHGSVAAFTFPRDEDVDGNDELWVAHLRRRGNRCLITTARRLRASGLRSASVLTDPVVTRDFVYWVAGPDTNAEEFGASFVLRRRIPTPHCAQRGRVQVLRKTSDDANIAVTEGGVFYTQPVADPSQPGSYSLSLFEMSEPRVQDP